MQGDFFKNLDCLGRFWGFNGLELTVEGECGILKEIEMIFGGFENE